MIIVISLVAMGAWEFWGREALSYEEILVLKEPLEANTVLKEDHFALKRTESPSKDALSLKDKDYLIGMETSQFVAENTELRKEYFVETQYHVGGDTGKGMMAVSMDWLLSYPQTLMRGDEIGIYDGSTKIGECVVAHVRDSSNNEVVFSQGDRFTSSGTAIYIEVIGQISTLINISSEAAKGKRFSLVNLQ